MHAWLRDASEMLEAVQPHLWSRCYPRHILVPSGYATPKYYGVSVAGHLCMLQSVGPESPEAHTLVTLSSLNLARFGVPTYFVDKEFAEAVAHTRLPEGLRFSDLQWPLDALLFVLPEAFCRKHFGWHTPFIALNRIRKGQHPHPGDAPILAAATLNPNQLRPMLATSDRFSMAACLLPDDGTTHPIDYTASYPVDMNVNASEKATFMDATPYEYETWGVPRITGNMPTGAEDAVLTQKLLEFSVKLLLVLAARPGLVHNGTLVRPEKVKKGRTRNALWNPNTVGAGYRVNRPATGSSTGTHAGPRMHWRWGHYTHQAIGRRGDPDFVSVAELPRAEDGRIAWEKVPNAVRDAFWKCHKLVLIDPILVNAPDV